MRAITVAVGWEVSPRQRDPPFKEAMVETDGREHPRR